MTTTAIPTQDNRGLLPVGTRIQEGIILQASLTAYEVLTDPVADRSTWISFDQVHGRPAPVQPLLSFR